MVNLTVTGSLLAMYLLLVFMNPTINLYVVTGGAAILGSYRPARSVFRT